MLEEVPHIRSNGSERGMGHGWGEARGAWLRKSCMRKRGSESAMLLCIPGMCCAEISKLCLAAKRKRLRRRDMRWGQREVPVTMQCTTAWLSQSSRMRSVDQRSPHMYAASTMGYNSFHWMLCESCAGVHLPLNQWPWPYAP